MSLTFFNTQKSAKYNNAYNQNKPKSDTQINQLLYV